MSQSIKNMRCYSNSHPQSTLMCWALKKNIVEGIRVMSKYLVYTGTLSTSTRKTLAILDNSGAHLAS